MILLCPFCSSFPARMPLFARDQLDTDFRGIRFSILSKARAEFRRISVNRLRLFRGFIVPRGFPRVFLGVCLSFSRSRLQSKLSKRYSRFPVLFEIF